MAANVDIRINAIDNASGIIGNIVKGIAQGFGQQLFGAVQKGLAAIPKLLGDSIGAASDLNETVSKVGVVFGKYSFQIESWGKTAAQSFGLSENAALSAAGTYGNLFKSMGLGDLESKKMSLSLVELAADLASFNNIKPEEALEKLRAGLVGESEPLKSLGININEALLKEEALKLGLIKGKEALTASAKAQAAYSLILKQSTLAQGDFARTSTGLANQQRILDARIEDLKATLGTALLPIVNKVILAVTNLFDNPIVQTGIQFLVDGMENIAGIFGDFFDGLMSGEDIVGDISNVIYNLSQAFGATKEQAGILFTSFQNVFGWLQDNIPGIIANITTFVSGMFQTILDAWGNIGPSLITNVQSILTLISDLWTKHGQAVLDVIKFAWDNIVVVVTGAWLLVSGILKAGLQILDGDWSGAWETIKNTLSTIWDTIVQIVGDRWKDIFTAVSLWVLKTKQKIEELIASIFSVGNAVNAQATAAATYADTVTVGTQAVQGPPRANGGWVNSGMPYTVGERGIETFVPKQDGYIVPNGGSMGATYNIYAANDPNAIIAALQHRQAVERAMA